MLIVVYSVSFASNFFSWPMIVCVLPVPLGPASMAQWWSRSSFSSQNDTEALSPVGTVTSLMFASLELNTICA